MTLAELYENKFRGDIRFRGAAYLEAERVEITRVTPDDVFAVVRDGVEYQTQLSRASNQLRMYCNCAKGGQAEATCKHLWATLLAVDAGDLLSTALKPGYIPPFAAEPAREFVLDDGPLEEDDDQTDVYQPFRGATAAARTSVKVQPRLSEWEAQLQKVRQQISEPDVGPATTGREREIIYEIDVEESRTAQILVLQTSQRQRRANGQWGKLKPLKLRPGRLQEIEHEDDRRILAYLSGGTPERNSWHAQQAEFHAATHRYRVPTELCELLLPIMTSTGHLTIMGERADYGLRWDDGPPYELAMHVTRSEDASEWTLSGYLARGEEAIPLSEAVLLVPGGLVVTADSVARLDDFDAFAWISLLQGGKDLKVPDGEQEALVDKLLDIPRLPRLDLPKELHLEEVRASPKPHLILRTPKGAPWQQERLKGEVQFEYCESLVSASSPQWAIVQREEGQCIVRDRPAEQLHWSELQQCGFRRLRGQVQSRHDDVEIAARDLGPAVRTLFKNGWQVRADGREVHQPGEFNFRIQSGIDWFELHADIDFGGQTVAFPELLAALARGDATVRLSDGSLGLVPEEWAERYGLLARLGTAEDDHIRFSRSQASMLDALLATRETVVVDDKFEELRERLKSFSGLPEGPPAPNFGGERRHYQQEGLNWLGFLESFGFGGCLADDMGLGKTVQMLALLQNHYQARTNHRPSLAVVPKSLLFNWRQEAERFAPDLRVMEYTGTDRGELRDQFGKHELVLTTYGTLRRDILSLREESFAYAILDEAQMIKNAGSQVAKASRLISAEHRIALSGTPIENHLGDLWSIFEFLNPGMLGRSSVFKLYTRDSESTESRTLLSQALKPFILRRTKEEVATELPEKIEQTIFCRMGTRQRQLYDELRAHYRESLLSLVKKQGLSKSKIHVLEALLRLRQAACHPALLDRATSQDSSAKLDVLIPQIEELLDENHKALVFSQFTSMLSIVREHLDAKGIRYAYLDGQTRNRRQVVEEFQNDPDCGLFLISLKAGGLGLNLTAADYVFLLDPWWNPAVETQAIDRAHRVGQTRKVIAYRLICQDTVEEKIAELQQKKRELADAILEENGSLIQDLTTEDIASLLS